MYTLKESKNVANKFRKYLRIGGKHYSSFVVGSLRRNISSLHDIDILVIIPDEKRTNEISLINCNNEINIKEISKDGNKRKEIIIVAKDVNYKIDLYYTNRADKGYAMLHFTGPKSYNIRIRAYAKKKGWKLNQYGLFDVNTGKQVVYELKTEREIVSYLGVTYYLPSERK